MLYKEMKEDFLKHTLKKKIYTFYHVRISSSVEEKIGLLKMYRSQVSLLLKGKALF